MDYDILVTAAETVWVTLRSDTSIVGLSVSLTDTEPPPSQPSRELAPLHPFAPSTARIYTQTSRVEFTEPAKLYVGSTERIDLDETPNPESLRQLAIPPGKYLVRASTWHYANSAAPVRATDSDRPADAFPVQVRLAYWPVSNSPRKP